MISLEDKFWTPGGPVAVQILAQPHPHLANNVVGIFNQGFKIAATLPYMHQKQGNKVALTYQFSRNAQVLKGEVV